MIVFFKISVIFKPKHCLKLTRYHIRNIDYYAVVIFYLKSCHCDITGIFKSCSESVLTIH